MTQRNNIFWILDFFTRFTCEKTPQNNFSCQKFSIENNYFANFFFNFDDLWLRRTLQNWRNFLLYVHFKLKKNSYFLHWNSYEESCFVVFFHKWNEWKNPQFNCLSWNLSIEHNFQMRWKSNQDMTLLFHKIWKKCVLHWKHSKYWFAFFQVEILHEIPQIEKIYMAFPNVHYFNVDLSKFPKSVGGCTGNNEVFQPVDKPSGYITLTLGRKDLLSKI